MSSGLRARRQFEERRGSAIVLVLITAAVAFIIGLTFLGSATTITSIARAVDHHAQSRQIAESGLEMVRSYIEQNAEWRDSNESGEWLSDMSLLGGEVTVQGEFDPDPSTTAFTIDDFSFEDEIAELPNPALSPPMQGVIGGWDVVRTAAVETGATVPRIGVAASADATNGSNTGFVSFPGAADSSASFKQALGVALEPYTNYEIVVDIAPVGAAILDTSFGFRLFADDEVVASTEHASTLAIPALPEEMPTDPADPPTPPEEDSLLEVLALAGGFYEYRLQFTTDGAPLTGELSIELFAATSAALTDVQFDNVRLFALHYPSVTLTAIGRYENTSHVVASDLTAIPEVDGTSIVRILKWRDQR